MGHWVGSAALCTQHRRYGAALMQKYKSGLTVLHLANLKVQVTWTLALVSSGSGLVRTTEEAGADVEAGEGSGVCFGCGRCVDLEGSHPKLTWCSSVSPP